MTYAASRMDNGRPRSASVTGPPSQRSSAAAVSGASSRTTGAAHSGSRAAVAVSVSTTAGAASPSTKAMRSAGLPGSIGRYAAPEVTTPSRAVTSRGVLGSATATSVPGPAPAAIRWRASPPAAAASSAYVSVSGPRTTAGASGVRAAWAVNSSGRVAAGTSMARPAAYPDTSRSRRSAGSIARRSTGRSGSSAADRSTRARYAAKSSAVAWSNRSTLYWMSPWSPAGPPSASYSSEKPKARSNRAAPRLTTYELTSRPRISLA
ncbi:hypothetical protein GCM10022420_064190 [Streptomyces iranensis]